MKTLTDIVIGCENFLGYIPPRKPGSPVWKARATEVVKLKKAMEGVPNATIENLALALEYSRRKRMGIKSPITLIFRIPDALELVYREKPMTDIATEIAAAIGWEKERNDELSLRWIHQLTRAAGPGRTEALSEWREASRG